MSDIIQRIDKLILENSKGGAPPSVFLSNDEWSELFEALADLDWEPYGSPITSKEYLEKGYDNFMFRGSAICIMPEYLDDSEYLQKVGNYNG